MFRKTDVCDVLVSFQPLIHIKDKNINDLLIEAEKELLEAEALMPGSAAYNLGCVYARLGNETECQRWLARTKELGKLPDQDNIATDPDLENVRDSQWFKDFLGEL